jgi:hypothetical protein
MIHKFSTVQIFRESDNSTICSSLGITGEIFPSSQYFSESVSPSVTGVGAASSYLSLADAEKVALTQARDEAVSDLECTYNVNVLFTGQCPYGSDVGFVITSGEETNTDPYLAYVAAYEKATGDVPNACVSPASPIILTHPIDIVKDAGQSASMTVDVYGTSPLSYQWYLNDSAISGENSVSYNVASVSSGDIGDYFVEVTNFVGRARSRKATLEVTDSPPVIVSQPQNTIVTAGGITNFEVVVASSSSVDYQWKKNGSNINGKISARLEIASVTPSDEGAYKVEVTNAFGSVTSDEVALNVNTLPSIVIGPSDKNKEEGENVTFAVVAEGSAPLSYQWRKNGNSIGGADEASYQILNAQSSDAATYSVDVSNSIGSVSASGSLTVSINDVVPPSLTISNVSNATLSNGKYFTSASGVNVFGLATDNVGVSSVVWLDDHGNSGVPVGVSSWQTTGLIVPTGDTTVTVRAYDAANNLASGQITIHRAGIDNIAASIISPTELDTYETADSVIPVVVAASGVTEEEIQFVYVGNVGLGSGWSKQAPGAPYSGQVNLWDGQTNTVNAIMKLRDGRSYTDSLSVTLSSTPPTGEPPSIVTQPFDLTKNIGDNAIFSVVAAGAAPLRYQWYRNGIADPNGVNQIYTIIGVAAGHDNDGYNVLVSNDFNQVSSRLAKLDVITGPTITRQPSSASVLEGGNVNFSTLYQGSIPMTFQWKKDGVNIAAPQGTYQTLQLTNVSSSDEADYTCVLTNSNGSTTTNAATLTTRTATFAFAGYASDMVPEINSRHSAWFPNAREDLKFTLDYDTGGKTIDHMVMVPSVTFIRYSTYIDYPSHPLGVALSSSPSTLLRYGFSNNLGLTGTLSLVLYGDARYQITGTTLRPSNFGNYTMTLTIHYTDGTNDTVSTAVTTG